MQADAEGAGRDADPSEVRLTDTYLDESEYAVLATLPASVLRKTLRVASVGRVDVVVDEFDDHLAGLRLAEVEVAALDVRLPHVSWLGREVSADDRYSGGCLAVATRQEAESLLADDA